MPIYFGSNFAREPFQFDSVGNDWEQESVTRPEGYPLYHYLQTKEGVGEVTVYSRNQAVSDNILSNSHTIELQKGQGFLLLQTCRTPITIKTSHPAIACPGKQSLPLLQGQWRQPSGKCLMKRNTG